MSCLFLSDFIVLKSISKSNYTVHLVTLKNTRKSYAVKVFPHNQKGPCNNYFFESRFSWVQHPCIIQYFDTREEAKGFFGENRNISYIMMELAPHGDFWTLISRTDFCKDEVLARTYFRQLLSGLKYLHRNKVCHMDLKPQNLLLGEDYLLKITDFDHAIIEEDNFVSSKGTYCFRAPEIIEDNVVDAQSADVYSLGIILFCFIVGHLPYQEGVKFKGRDLYRLMINNDADFWKMHKLETIDESFKTLFMSMVNPEYNKRIKLVDIENTEWMKKTRYGEDDMISKIKEVISPLKKGR